MAIPHGRPPSDSRAVATPPRRGHYLLAAVLASAALTYLSFVPWQFVRISLAQAAERFRRLPWLELDVYSRADWVVNLLLLVPVGFLWMGAVDLDRRRRWGSALATPLVALGLGLLIAGIEFGQAFFPLRTMSQNDLAAEAIGSVIGIGLWWVAGRRLNARLRGLLGHRRQQPRGLPILKLYTLLLLFMALQPLDLVASPAEIARKAADGRILLTPFSAPYQSTATMLWDLLADAALFVPVGMLMRLGWMRRGIPRSLAAAVGWTVLLALFIEACQVLVFTRFVDATDVVTATLGGLAGAWVAGVGGRDPLRPHPWLTLPDPVRVPVALLLQAVYAAGILWSYWHPFRLVRNAAELEARWRHFLDYPFKAYYWGSEFSALMNMTRAFMLFLVLGLLWRWMWGPGRPQGWLALGLLVSLALGLGLLVEVGQVFIQTRTADATNLPIYLAGALAGWAAASAVLKRIEPDTGR